MLDWTAQQGIKTLNTGFGLSSAEGKWDFFLGRTKGNETLGPQELNSTETKLSSSSLRKIIFGSIARSPLPSAPGGDEDLSPPIPC